MNARLKSAVKLDRKIALYIPATVDVDKSADNSAQVDRAAALLSDLFGGATIQPGAGCWMSDSAGLVKEATTLVYAFCDAAGIDAGLDAVLDFSEKLKVEMAQESIAVEINGVLYLI